MNDKGEPFIYSGTPHYATFFILAIKWFVIDDQNDTIHSKKLTTLPTYDM